MQLNPSKRNSLEPWDKNNPHWAKGMFLKSTPKKQSKPASNESKSESKDNITIKEELKPEKNIATNSTDKKAKKKESPHWAKGMFQK